ncbi:MAG: hypothetical protein DRQ99_06905, partial [Candidatus Parabeggiatoa sp. nov. 3]
FCVFFGMPVILRVFWNACYFACFLECLLFCVFFGMPVILRVFGMPVILRGFDKTQFMTKLSI